MLALALAGCGGGSGDEPPAIVESLRAGGLVLVVRHAPTESTTDTQEFLRSCSLQRNLSAAGREQARAIGEAIRELEIPIGEVRASPMCRTRDTARLMFGKSTPDRELVSPGVIGTVADDTRRAARLRELVRARPRGANTVLVTHTGNIGEGLGESLVEGEMLVYDRGELVGRIKPDDWAGY